MADGRDPTREVLDAMAAAGCAPQDPGVIVFDGRLHRFDVEGDRRGRRNGGFVLHGGPVPGGSFWSWKTGVNQTWRAAGAEEALTPEQRRLERARVEAAKARRSAERERLRAQAQERAAALWARARPSVDAAHPYLAKKRVPAIGLRQLGELLVVPVADAGGVLRSLQFISAEGDKKFLAGGEVEGRSHLLRDPAGARALLLCEGYATGASLHQATGLPVAVCFNRVNLLPAAKEMRRRFPGTPLILAADDDRDTPGNPGRRDAEEAARWVKGAVILPDFAGLDTSARPTDFNDVHVLGGLEHLKRQLERQLAALLPPDAPPEPARPPAGSGGRDGGRAIEPAAGWASVLSGRAAPGEPEPVLAMAAPARRGGGAVRRERTGGGRADLYREVTDKILERVEAGTAPWRRPWGRARHPDAPEGPFNAATGRPYRGVNVLLLGGDPRTDDDPRWCGFRQAKARGWQVKAGARGTAVYFFKRLDAGEGEDDDPENPRRGFAILRRHTVFHASQIEGMPSMEDAYGPAETVGDRWEMDARLRALVAGTGASIAHGGDPAYLPKPDSIRLPPPERYPDQASYFKTLFHELAHWTAHPSRLNRPLAARRASPDYAREELRAELASAFMGAALGIPHDLDNHASYLAHYRDLLRGDSREIFRAARDAHAIADLILGRHPDLRLETGVCVPRGGPWSDLAADAGAGGAETALADGSARQAATEPATEAPGPRANEGESGRVLRIVAPRFCAGLILRGGKVIEAAPILRRMVGMTEAGARDAIARQGWTCDEPGAPPAAADGPAIPDGALPAPYRWALAALADRETGFGDGPLDRLDRRLDAAFAVPAEAGADAGAAESRTPRINSRPQPGGHV